jgi:hypothetical protein
LFMKKKKTRDIRREKRKTPLRRGEDKAGIK